MNLEFDIIKPYEKISMHWNDFQAIFVESFYGIDGYLVINYPDGHPYNFRTKSDLSYWSDWFSKSRMSRT